MTDRYTNTKKPTNTKSDSFRFTDMRPTSKWAEMTKLSFALTKKGKGSFVNKKFLLVKLVEGKGVSSEEAKELGVGQLMAR